MESWSCVSDKGFASDGSVSANNGFKSGKSGILGSDSNSPYCYGSNMMIFSQETIKNQGFFELGSQEMTRLSIPNFSIRDATSSKIGDGRIVNPVTATSNEFFREESGSNRSSFALESNSQNLSFIDLNLVRFPDQSEVQNSNSAKAAPTLPSAASSLGGKRMRWMGSSSQIPFCQVHGCKKDLSSSKDYHKRHKVCEAHSKTAKVIVNGIEQRFCQQCSRFHLLGEFDDGKRSCRKRLAGHNERRRKPHGIQSGRAGRLFPSRNGTIVNKFLGTELTSSFICEDILPDRFLQKYKTDNWYRHLKLEDGSNYSPVPATDIRNEHFHPNLDFTSCDYEKRYPPFQDNEMNTSTGSNANDDSNHFPNHLGGSSSASRWFFENSSSIGLGSLDFPFLDAVSTVHGISEISNSGCALSLLSSQSKNSSSRSSGIPISHPLNTPSSNGRYSESQISEKFLGISPQGSTCQVSNKLRTFEMNSAEENHLAPVLIPDDNDALTFVVANGNFQGSEYMNAKDYLSCEEGSTIDLLQLSSQLQRVDHQRHSMQVKQENDALWGPGII